MIRTIRARRLLLLMAAAGATAPLFQLDSARATEPPVQAQQSTPDAAVDTPKGIDTVTVEGRREVKRRINDFVSGVLVTYLNDSLMRWDAPICPMIVGLPSDQGEYIAARLSQVARDVHAPLAVPGSTAGAPRA